MSDLEAPVSVAILAGGGSTRFPGDKALCEYGGTQLYRRAAGAFAPYTDDIFFQVRREQKDLVSAVKRLPADVGPPGICYDLYPGKGPLGGILTALQKAEHRRVFAVAVDLLRVDGRLLEALAARLEGAPQAVVPRWPDGKMEPLCAVYSKELEQAFLSRVEMGLPESMGDGERDPGLGMRRTIELLVSLELDVQFLDIPEFLGEHGLEEDYFSRAREPGDLECGEG